MINISIDSLLFSLDKESIDIFTYPWEKQNIFTEYIFEKPIMSGGCYMQRFAKCEHNRIINLKKEYEKVYDFLLGFYYE